MTDWFGLILNVIFTTVVAVGIVQAVRLINQLRDLRASRTEMERFVRDFNAAVMRAEAGIKALRAAARESGDDLEKLVDNAHKVRDELTFLVESADGVAERLSSKASSALVSDAQQSKTPDPAKSTYSYEAPASDPAPLFPPRGDASPSSRAEKELLQALQKLK